MQDKQKVTLYLPPGVHRQLKIKAAIDDASMSGLVEKALNFYLQYPEKVEEIEANAHGRTHQVHICPECDAALVVRDRELASIKNQPSVISDDFSLEVSDAVPLPKRSADVEEEVLVSC